MMAKLAVLAVLASLLGSVSCEFSIYAGYGYPPPNPGQPYPLPPACPPLSPAPSLKGCDASVLLSGPETERTAFPNLSLRGFEVIDAAKAALEKACQGVVSCADIVAFAGRDASYSLSDGKINYVPAGRYDGNVSRDFDTFFNLPPPFGDLNLTTAMFAAKGLNENDMVVLSGAHSIGRSSCNSFSDRLPPAANSSTAMEPILAADLTNTCSAGTVNVPQDFKTADTLDIQYYKNVLSRDVLFNSDASLTTSLLTNGWVDFYAGNRPSFLDESTMDVR
ncbi:hypothetical protein ACQ4PT_016002 [Festuca glaucescens]